MSQNNVVSSGPIRNWGERTMPLLKRQLYVFSIDLSFDVNLYHVGRVRDTVFVSLQNSTPSIETWAPLFALSKRDKHKPLHCGEAFHVQDEVLVKTADGMIRDVPRGKFVRSNEWLSVGDGGIGSAAGRCLLVTDVDTYISIEYTGTIRLDGQALRLLTQQHDTELDLQASTYVSLRSQCERPKYRWLVENQLFGFGRLRVVQPAWDKPGDVWTCSATVSYDVYSMGGS